MGIIAKNQHDVFFSYATLDNDLQSNWIKDFREDLRARVLLELRSGPYRDLDIDQIDFFIDDKGLPANGGLIDELVDAINKSNFLFMFVGENYLTSDYCAKELDWFSRRFASIERQALNHMFFLLLTRAALKGASAGKLGEIKTKARYYWVYDEESGNPVARWLQTEQGKKAVRNPAYTALVNDIAKTLVERILDKPIDIPAAAPATGEAVVAFGAVTRSLKEYRAAAANDVVQALGIKADLLELDDLAAPPDEIRARLKQAKLFVQFVDKSPIGILGGSQPGGFLALQEELVPPNLQTLWMEPRDKTDVAIKETDATHLAYLDRQSAAALKLSRPEFVQELGKRLRSGNGRGAGTAPDQAKIMFEQTDSDQEQVLEVRHLVEAAWSDIPESNQLRLRFSALEWDQIKQNPELLQDCHGIVVVDRSKPLKTLYVQMDDIEDELARHNYELEYRTFVLPPKSSPTIMNWPTILFKEMSDNPNLQVVTKEKLREFLGSVRDKALAAKSAGPGTP